MIVLTANICFDGFGGSVFEDQVDHFSVDKVNRGPKAGTNDSFGYEQYSCVKIC